MLKQRIILFCMIASISFTLTPEQEAERLLNIQQQEIERNLRLQEEKRRQEELENSRFNEQVPKLETPSIENGNTFFINQIYIYDSDDLLSKREKKKLTTKYLNKELGAKEINELLTEVNNKLIQKGYTTSRVKLEDNQNLMEGIISLSILPGRVEEVILNDNWLNDKLKVSMTYPKGRNDILNIRNTDTMVDQFNKLNSNNFEVKVYPSEDINGYSKLVATNVQKNRAMLSMSYDDHGANRAVGKERLTLALTIDSPLELNDYLRVSYKTVNKETPDRNWKIPTHQLQPGEIAPIRPPLLPLDKEIPKYRRSDSWDIYYRVPFRSYTISLSSNNSFYGNSVYQYNSIYDSKGNSRSLGLNIDKILYRNQTSKLTAAFDLKRKHNTSYFEEAKLTDRYLTIGSLSLNYSYGLFKGIGSLNVGYHRGLPWFKAEHDKNKNKYMSKAGFDKYTFDTSWYKPITIKKHRFSYRVSLSGTYTEDVLYGSERMSIGGIGDVPGYNNASLSGDKGISLSNELSYSLRLGRLGSLSPYIGYNIGYVKYNYDNSKYGKGHLSGSIVGLRYNAKYLDFDIAYAKPDSASFYVDKENHEVYSSVTLKFLF